MDVGFVGRNLSRPICTVSLIGCGNNIYKRPKMRTKVQTEWAILKTTSFILINGAAQKANGKTNKLLSVCLFVVFLWCYNSSVIDIYVHVRFKKNPRTLNQGWISYFYRENLNLTSHITVHIIQTNNIVDTYLRNTYCGSEYLIHHFGERGKLSPSTREHQAPSLFIYFEQTSHPTRARLHNIFIWKTFVFSYSFYCRCVGNTLD